MALGFNTTENVVKIVNFEFEIETPEDIPAFNDGEGRERVYAITPDPDVLTSEYDDQSRYPEIEWDEDTNILRIYGYKTLAHKQTLTREQFPLTISFRSDDFGAIIVDHG